MRALWSDGQNCSHNESQRLKRINRFSENGRHNVINYGVWTWAHTSLGCNNTQSLNGARGGEESPLSQHGSQGHQRGVAGTREGFLNFTWLLFVSEGTQSFSECCVLRRQIKASTFLVLLV